MLNQEIEPISVVLVLAGPLLLMSFGLFPSPLLNRNHQKAARFGEALAAASLCTALLASVGLFIRGPFNQTLCSAGPFQLGIHFDSLSSILLILVSFLAFIVIRFSRNYLAGDPAQGRFTKWLCLTSGSVLSIVVSGNLVQFALAWSATSFCLHRLLIFYSERPGALLAARKKFIISRLGDLCLLGAIALVYQVFNTWNFSELFAAANRLDERIGEANLEIHIAALLLVAGAMLKSAQFPFHSWLPDTMETPTPVSALMHAGIINAGGFLVIRLSPLINLSPFALSILALVGAFTAVFASLVMLTHASVKRSLAFSTVAQMGFMMLECGLGAYSLAVLHLVAHSLYKAHAFLSSGSIVAMAKAAWTPSEEPSRHPFKLAASLLTAMTLTAGAAWLFDIHLLSEPGMLVIGSAYVMAIAYMLWNFWSRPLSFMLTLSGIFAAAVACITYFSLHHLFQLLIGSVIPVSTDPVSAFEVGLSGILFLLFLSVLLLQAELPAWANRPYFRRLYVHARNGFYLNTLANRLAASTWSIKTP